MKKLTEFQQEFLAIFKRNGVTFHNRKGEISDTTTNCVTVTDTATNEVILKITFSDENILEILENMHNERSYAVLRPAGYFAVERQAKCKRAESSQNTTSSSRQA